MKSRRYNTAENENHSLALRCVFSVSVFYVYYSFCVEGDAGNEKRYSVAQVPTSKLPDGWLGRIDIDLSQTRLPTFTVALAYMLFNDSGLILARYISCLTGINSGGCISILSAAL